MTCPSQHELLECLLGKLPEIRSEQLLAHAEECDACGKWIADSDQKTDDLVVSLRKDHQSEIDASVHCERMIQQAEQYVPATGRPLEPLGTDEPSRHLLQGTRVRDYEILSPIGEGGMGTVFLARHIRLNRRVAIKVLSLGRQRNSEAQKRFEQEMQNVGQLQHSGIVQALDAGEDHGIQYLVMEVIDGVDLRRIVQLAGPLELPDACEIIYQVAKALEYAHSQKLIHRDIKPSNVMLARDGTVKVMDLGISKFADQQQSLTSTQQALGSLDFMAPEQLQAQRVDGRADVFALGCTLHFLLTGEPPLQRRSASLLVSKSPKLQGLRHTLPPPVTRLLQDMLAPSPGERCESMTEVADRLKPYCGSADLAKLAAKSTPLVESEKQGAVEVPTSELSAEKHREQRSRSRWHWIAAAACGTAIFAAAGWVGSKLMGPMTQLAELPVVTSNVEPVREIPLFQIHESAIRAAAYCEATSQLIVSSDDPCLSVRDLPNQCSIQNLMVSDAPIVSVAVAQETNRFVAVDDTGVVMAFDLPEGNLVWRSETAKAAPTDGGSKAYRLEVSIRDVVSLLNGTRFVTALRLRDGHLDPTGQLESSDHATANEVELAAQQFRIAAEEISHAQPLAIPDAMAWVVSQGRRVWVLDEAVLMDPTQRTFAYSEHDAKITTLLTFADESMVLSGDAVGRLRLWQAPNTRYSDMLLGCATRIDSMEMSFALRQDRWTKQAFSASPDRVHLDDHGGALKLKTTIERDTLEHTLQYKVISEEAAEPSPPQ